MTSHWIEFINSQCPLQIAWVAWEDPTLVLRGANWSFTTLSSWRLLAADQYVVGSEDADATEYLRSFASGTIIAAEAPSRSTSDLRLHFADNSRLEVFVASAFEPWTFRLPHPPTLVPGADNLGWFSAS